MAAFNPSAFPHQPTSKFAPGADEFDPGMTLRDWFAGQALAGIMANPAVVSVPDSRLYLAAYQHADGMLARRAQ